MSKVKVSFLVVGLLAVAAIALAIVGTDQLNASSTANSDITNASADAGDAKTSALPCGGGDKKACGSASSKACPGSSSCGTKQAKTASIEPISKREGQRVVLVGHYVCGSCNLGVSEKCAAAFQTKEGKNYLLVKNNLSKDLKAKTCKSDVEIVTIVKKYEGTKYLQVETINPVS
jgi:hypothetical protein